MERAGLTSEYINDLKSVKKKICTRPCMTSFPNLNDELSNGPSNDNKRPTSEGGIGVGGSLLLNAP